MSIRAVYLIISLCVACFWAGLVALTPIAVAAPAMFIAAFVLTFGGLCLGRSAAMAGRNQP